GDQGWSQNQQPASQPGRGPAQAAQIDTPPPNVEAQAGVRKIAEKKEQFSAPTASIFVPVRGAGSAGSSGVELGDETFYSPAEMSGREASANGTSEREDLHQPAAQTGQIL